MSKSKLAAACALLSGLFVASAFAEPLPSDPRIKTGKLDNGVKWMFFQHANPPGRMALMVHVDAGSLDETDAQRGLAHFMEHMAFNGTEHFPPGELIKYFESIGMEFGNDLNAFTSFDQTAYMLFVPTTDEAQLDKALMTLSDYVFRASLLKDEIDKERGVILEEWRSGKNAEERVWEESIKKVYDGTRLAVRIPIGIPDVIKGAPQSQFVDFYRTWYRPENVTVMLVGDASPEPIIPLVEKWFGQYKSELPAREPKTAELNPFTAQRAFVITDKELAGCEVEMTNVTAKRPPTTTVEQARTDTVERVATWIVNRRLEEKVQKGEAAYRDARVRISSFLNDGMMASASVEGEPDQWQKMLDQVIIEVSRAREHGFTQRELDLAKKELTADAERAVQTEPTRNARSFLFSMNRSLADKEPVMSAQQRLDLTRSLLDTIKVAELNDAFAKHFGADTFTFLVTMPEKEGVTVPKEDEVLAAARAALARKTEAPTEEAAPTELLTKEPGPGSAVETTVDKDLDIASAWLANGVRVHHRFMDYKKDQVLVSIELAGGRIEESANNLGITSFVAWCLDHQPATGRLSSTNVRDIMTGTNINVGAGSRSSDSLSISVSGSPKDLEKGLRLVYALLTEGKLEESGLKKWQQEQVQQLGMFSRYPEFQAAEALGKAISNGDPRFRRLPSKESVESLTLDEAQKWFDRLRREAPIEVAIVGEVPRDDAMGLIQKYVGSLPKRERSASYLTPLRKLNRGDGPFIEHVEVDTVTPKAMVIGGFLSADPSNDYERRALDLASETLSSRLIKRIREDLSLVYSTRAASVPRYAYQDTSMFLSQARCDPEKADTVIEEMQKAFADYAKSGPTAVELENAKKQIDNNLEENMREPSYWLRVLNDLTYHGKSLDEEKKEAEAYKTYTAKQVAEVFAKYYKPEREFSIVAVPASTAGETQPGQPVGASSK